MQIKRAGCCTVCDGEVYEIKQTHSGIVTPEGKKIPKRVGKPLPEARIVTFRLSDGSRIDLTICSGCMELHSESPEFLPHLWRKCARSNLWYHQNRLAMGSRPLRPDQAEKIEEDIASLGSKMILGIVSVSTPGGEIVTVQ